MHCLTGNGEPAVGLSGGTYGYFEPSLKVEKFPVRVPEPEFQAGPIPFADGALTSGRDVCVEWDPFHLRPNGVEAVFDMGRECTVEKIVLRHSSSPSAFNFYNDPHTSDRGIASIEVRLYPTPSEVLVFSESAEQGGSLPEEITISFPAREAREVAIRLEGRRGLGLREVQIWGKE